MSIHNNDIAAVFDEIADLLEIEAANPFRIRAYRNGARTLRDMGEDVQAYLARGEDLTRLAGIGRDLASKIREILATGTCRTLKTLGRQFPADLTELLKLPGLGPRRVHALYHELHIHTLEQLQRALHDGAVARLPGFGEKTEARILAAIESHVEAVQRFKLSAAAQYAEPLVAYLGGIQGVRRVVIAGSYRRSRETIGDLDILVTLKTKPAAAAGRPGKPGRRVIDRLVQYREVEHVPARGETRATVILHGGLQVDVRVVNQISFGAALHYFTGSRAHSIALRQLARQRGLKINEYGVFRGSRRVAGETEGSVYRAVGLPFIEPELRENRGEIEAAQAGLLPKLLTLGDLKGDLHAHTNATDGHAPLKAMAEGARQHGLEYLAITDHSKHLAVTHGLDSRRLLAQIHQIDELNASLPDITLLKGIEVDILQDGSLDLPDEVLSRLDLVIGAVHSDFGLSRARQTRRILRAMDHPCFTLLAHPGGRLINRREPYDVDMARIIRHARERGCFLELNAHPNRLDLLDVHCQMAREEGVLISIGSDAHSLPDLDNLRFGVGQARRGWLEKKDVLNTRSLAELRKLLKGTRH